ncbi:DUF3887 domain-containing protein [bacterium]|nr:DUF3887 domain-containing protein [bacterium]
MKSIMVLGVVLCVFANVAVAGDDFVAEIKAKAEPVVKHFFESYEAKNYEAARRDFDDKMRAGLPASQMQALEEQDLAKYGKIDSWKFSGWLREGSHDTAFVDLKREKGPALQYRFVFKTGPGEKRLGGLWYKPIED